MFCSIKQVITRKEHHCFGCECIFPKGSQLEKNAGIWEGQFYSYYLCKICQDFLPAHPKFSEDGLNAGCIYHEGWSPHYGTGEWIANWLKDNKPLSVAYCGRWRKTKTGYERL